MATQIKHESEYYRQHVRYLIPAKLVFESQTIELHDWSVSGISIDDMPDNIGECQNNKAQLVFEFDFFSFVMPIDIERVRFDKETKSFAGKFANLTNAQLSLLHYVINAFISGEVVSAGDILSVSARDGFIEKDFSKRLDQGLSAWQKTILGLKQFLSYGLFFGLIAGLLFFSANTLYQRLFIIESLSAKILAPITVLRAPDNGFFYNRINDASNLKPGLLMGIVKLVGGGTASVELPCICEVVETHAADGVFIEKGEPLFTLLPPKATLSVDAQIDFEDVRKIKIGDAASVRLTDGSVLPGTVEKVTGSISAELSASAAASSPLRATVLVSVQSVIPLEMLGTVAYVQINTF